MNFPRPSLARGEKESPDTGKTENNKVHTIKEKLDYTGINPAGSVPNDVLLDAKQDGTSATFVGRSDQSSAVDSVISPVESEKMAEEVGEAVTNGGYIFANEVKNKEAYTGTNVPVEDAKVTTQTIESGTQIDVSPCSLGNVSMCRIRKITTSGVR